MYFVLQVSEVKLSVHAIAPVNLILLPVDGSMIVDAAPYYMGHHGLIWTIFYRKLERMMRRCAVVLVRGRLVSVDRRQWTEASGQKTVDRRRWTVDSGQKTVDRRQWTVDSLCDHCSLASAQATVGFGSPQAEDLWLITKAPLKRAPRAPAP